MLSIYNESKGKLESIDNAIFDKLVFYYQGLDAGKLCLLLGKLCTLLAEQGIDAEKLEKLVNEI